MPPCVKGGKRDNQGVVGAPMKNTGEDPNVCDKKFKKLFEINRVPVTHYDPVQGHNVTQMHRKGPSSQQLVYYMEKEGD